uniref:FERM domain-containing protein n=1 Tax=Heterorhabditis bacteriophora TaxID=37862 RepID=A0A1I7XIX3_HETBA
MFYLRSEHVLRNRLPGILKEKSRINMKKHLENSYEFLKMGACVAEACDIFRDYSLELFNVGMLRESISNAQLALWCSLKTAVQFRLVASRSMVLVFSYGLILIFLGFNNSSILWYLFVVACRYPNIIVSFHSIGKVCGCCTLPVCSLHNLSKHCDCNLCEMCRTNYNASFEYYLSYFLFEGMSDISLECLKDYFFSLRVRVAVEQCSVLEKKRPPALMCELFGMAVVRWLRHLEIVRWDKTDVKRVALRNNMMEVAAKICSYSSMRTICYSLAISHLLRREKAIHRFEYPWMQDEEFQRDRKLAFLTDVVQCLSPYPVNINKCGGGSTISPVVSSSVIAFSKSSADAMIIEARKEYSAYSHLFYRDWRFPVCTYMGEGCSSSWEAAMMWAESTVLATRQAGRYLSGKIKGFAYQESSLFKKMVENLPEDFTVIQLALSEDGSLYLVKLHRDREPIIAPLAPAYKVKAMCKKMDKILSANDETGYLGRNSKDAKAYWVARRNVDQQLKVCTHVYLVLVFCLYIILFIWFTQDLLPEIETSLLGPSAALLIASATVKKSSKGMAAAERIVRASRTRDGSCLSISSAKICISEFKFYCQQELVALSVQLKENEWMALAERLCDLSGLSLTQKEAVSAEYSRSMKIACMEDELDQVDRRYTFLLICPDLALIPWEVLPNFCDRRYVGRIASLHAFFRLLNKYQKVLYMKVSNSILILNYCLLF